jgi:hypothetical protein
VGHHGVVVAGVGALALAVALTLALAPGARAASALEILVLRLQPCPDYAGVANPIQGEIPGGGERLEVTALGVAGQERIEPSQAVQRHTGQSRVFG